MHDYYLGRTTSMELIMSIQYRNASHELWTHDINKGFVLLTEVMYDISVLCTIVFDIDTCCEMLW